jgi:putative ABC transport system permease protein
MYRNYVLTALRNLVRNRLYAAISILSLAIGMAAAILTFLFVRDELTFDRFLPDRDRTFVVQTRFARPGQRPEATAATIAPLASWMKVSFPEVKRVARYRNDWVYIKQGATSVYQNVGWVDPGFFRIIPVKALAGDPEATIAQPDGLVLTHTAARRYFGVDAPLGRTLVLQQVPAPGKVIPATLKVGAVIEDRPSNTNITAEMFASGLGPIAPQTEEDVQPYQAGSYWLSFPTFVQLGDPRQAASVDRRLQAVVAERMFPPPVLSHTPVARSFAMSLAPISRMHLIPGGELPTANPALLSALTATALLILFAAGLNFVNLATARAARRAVEVGVRKVSGAARHHLMLQFLGESLIYAAVAGVLAVALAEAGVPALDGFVQRAIRFPYWRDPELMALIAGLILVVGLLAGLYPALVLSSYRPTAAFKPGAAGSGRQILRRVLVVTQFALLIGLLSSILVIANQTRFALTKGTGLDLDQVVVTGGPSCRGAFAERLGRIPGVKGFACSSREAIGRGGNDEPVRGPDGRRITIGLKTVNFGFFELYGIHAIAGRLPDRAHGGDMTADGDPLGRSARPRGSVVNQAMVRALGLASPQAAVGQVFQVSNVAGKYTPVQIIGVIPDYVFDLTKGPAEPAYFPVVPQADADLSFKVAAEHIPETIAAVKAAWRESGSGIPLLWRFDSDYLNQIYRGVIREGRLIGALAGVAVLIAAMGLFGTAAFTAEQRTKEIGVRKAMGASTADVLRLMLWSFTQPVLWANLIAWPAGWWLMHRWLQGFSARIDLSPWYFLGAGAAAVAIAWLTVSFQSFAVARAKPVSALRYE